MRSGYLIIDVGTGNARVGIVTEDGEVLSTHTKNTLFHRDTAYPDSVYFDPGKLFQGICASIRKVLSRLPSDVRLLAVSATSARQGIVLMDRDMRAYYAMPNIDNRGREWEGAFADAEGVYAKTGRWLSTIFPALKLFALRKVRPELYERIYKIISISDWIGYMFTGICAYEYSQACETQLFDLKKQDWSASLCQKFSISRDILPDLVRSGSILGKIRTAVSGYTGLPENIPFIVSGADTQCAVAGSGANVEDIVIVSGTTTPLVRLLDRHTSDPRQRCWIDCHIRDGQYLLESNAGVTGLNLQRFKAAFLPRASYENMDRHIGAKRSASVCASLGTLVFWERRLLANGGFQFAAPLAQDMDRYDFVLAIANDIAFSIAANYENLMKIYPKKTPKLIGCGGGLQLRHICQTVADVTNMPFHLPVGFRQASLMGCRAICMHALGRDTQVPRIHMEYLPSPRRAEQMERYAAWNAYRSALNRGSI